jgi:hypothetical protein
MYEMTRGMGGTESYTDKARALISGVPTTEPYQNKSNMLLGMTKQSRIEPAQTVQVPQPEVEMPRVEPERVERRAPTPRPQPRMSASSEEKGTPPEPGLIWSPLSKRWVTQIRKTRHGMGYSKRKSATAETTYQPQ